MDANRTIEGTGLGMGITRNLIGLMNGELFVKSAPQKGSVFTVRLPQKSMGAGILGKEMAENLQNFQLMSINQVKRAQILIDPMPYGSVLIVDDVESNLYVAKGLLSPYRLSVDTAVSGFEAIKKIKAGNEYDIVFMDHMMPQMDGIEAMQELRALGYAGVVVVLTANALAGNDAMFMQKGFDGFLSKPIDMRQLNAVLNKFIRNRYPEKANTYTPETMTQAETSEIAPKLLQIFCHDAEKAAVTLRAAVASGDIKLFTTAVHAMKSALANIGESEASQTAFALENAGLKGDADFVAANADGFIERLEALVKNLSLEESADTGDADAMEDAAYLAEQLQIVKAACEDYDDAAAYAALDRLQEKPWKPATVAALDEIRNALFLHSDFDWAAKRGKDLLGGLHPLPDR
jgi:CheY-like chemotaxis protein